MKRKIKKQILLLLTVILLIALAGCSSNVDKSGAVAVVNSEKILKTEYENNLEIYKKAYEAQFGQDIWAKDTGDGRTFEEALKETVLENLIIETILLQKAEEMGIVITEEQIQTEIDNYKGFFKSEEEYKESLVQNNMTEEYLRNGIEKSLILTRFKEEIMNGISVSDEEAEKHFNDNMDLYIQVRARHILVGTEEEAKEILKQIESGTDFAELAKSKSLDPGSASTGGDLGYFTKGQMVPEFEKVAFSLEPGETSSIVKTDYGYHIIKVEDKLDRFEEVKEKIIEDIKNTKYEKQINELRENAEVEIFSK